MMVNYPSKLSLYKAILKEIRLTTPKDQWPSYTQCIKAHFQQWYKQQDPIDLSKKYHAENLLLFLKSQNQSLLRQTTSSSTVTPSSQHLEKTANMVGLTMPRTYESGPTTSTTTTTTTLTTNILSKSR